MMTSAVKELRHLWQNVLTKIGVFTTVRIPKMWELYVLCILVRRSKIYGKFMFLVKEHWNWYWNISVRLNKNN